MDKCLFCNIDRKSRKEFMEFLNWLAKKPYYEQIVGEYMERKKRGGE